jgi:nitrogen fixation protein NifU and related proteins
MNDQEFEEMVQKLQAEVHGEAQVALGEKGFDRWQNPKYHGMIIDADSKASLTGGCGDTMTMYLKVKDGRVAQASFETDGCGSSAVAGSFAAELAIGKAFDEVLDMTGADVLREIGTFPQSEEHCASLAVQTLQEALNLYLVAEAKGGKVPS